MRLVFLENSDKKQKSRIHSYFVVVQLDKRTLTHSLGRSVGRSKFEQFKIVIEEADHITSASKLRVFVLINFVVLRPKPHGTAFCTKMSILVRKMNFCVFTFCRHPFRQRAATARREEKEEKKSVSRFSR